MPSRSEPITSLTEALLNLPLLRSLPDVVKLMLSRAVALLLLFALFLVLRWVVTRLVHRATEAVVVRDQALGLEGRAARVRTLAGLIRSVLVYTLGFIFVVGALGAVGFDLKVISGLVATAGVAGLAVGFGAQKLVKDVISGFFLLLEDQYAVGDYVTINAVTGTVEEIGMRITRIRDDDGRLYILSNGDIAQVCNQSRGPVGGTFEVAIAASADIAQATQALNAAFEHASQTLALAEPARVDGVSAADAAKTALRVRFRARPDQRPADVAARLREAARAALHDAQIPLA